MNPDPKFWIGKKVLLTGHTGFKGSWLTFWLKQLGADVSGYALDSLGPHTSFSVLNLSSTISDYRGDINDTDKLNELASDSNPEILIHMAAQSLVRPSFSRPIETFLTNIMGTANILELARSTNSIRAVLIVTSDKCYENVNTPHPYSETDRLGGSDPYSSSKGCAEIITKAFRDSFFKPTYLKKHIGIATARAGNVIGGGDWAEDRLVPDAIRAFSKKSPLLVRSPKATRPWQHVLEPLSGYLLLLEHLYKYPECYSSAWNFGPNVKDITSVSDLCDLLVNEYGIGATWKYEKLPEESKLTEAHFLNLDISKVINNLPWFPRWSLKTAVGHSVSWYKQLANGGDVRALTEQQISEYLATPEP